MSKIFEPKNLLKKIKEGKELEEIINYVKGRLFKEGPVDTGLLEIISYLKLMQPNTLQLYEQDILEIMGVFFKNAEPSSLSGLIFNQYSKDIKERYGEDYTPLQASIVKHIREKKNFSFSAPTSTGKSYVFRNIIKDIKKDSVIIVPSRALINEYYDQTKKIINDKKVNILTFVDKINTKHSTRTVFILTPERARELFKNNYDIELFLFDEAQLGDEDSIRGIHFDSIVRRVQRAYPNASCVFAHPFIANPEAQLKKCKIDIDLDENALSVQYKQKNVGQIFYSHDSNWNYYHVGVDKNIFGTQKILSDIDPLSSAIQRNGSILIFTAKDWIYKKTVFNNFKKYIDMCKPITDPEALEIINRIQNFLGAGIDNDKPYYSDIICKLKCGIVIHHGSLPLQCRLELEHFTQKGFCRICFATSTLEQGINMPFDVVYLDRLSSKKTLALKNLIGRAGRSTDLKKFDFGSVVVKDSRKSELRSVLKKENKISDISHLDRKDENVDPYYNELKDAINNKEFSDEYNLTNEELKRLSDEEIKIEVTDLLTQLFDDKGKLVSLRNDENDRKLRKQIYDAFDWLYSKFLKRPLVVSEKAVLNTGVKIMLWKAYHKTFKDICQFRYNYVVKIKEWKISDDIDKIKARYLQGYADIPNKKLHLYPLFGNGKMVSQIDYDRIVFDTYDFLDKLIGFKLSDVYYAIFMKHYENTNDPNALRFAKYLKYGTEDTEEIMMLRYGLSFEDMEWAKNIIETIDTEQILFKADVNDLPEEQRKIIDNYLYADNIKKEEN